MKKIIGRKKELGSLKKIWNSKEAELVAIYGRQRVGKMFLIREFFESQGRYFELAGKKDSPPTEQLKDFKVLDFKGSECISPPPTPFYFD